MKSTSLYLTKFLFEANLFVPKLSMQMSKFPFELILKSFHISKKHYVKKTKYQQFKQLQVKFHQLNWQNLNITISIFSAFFSNYL